MTKLDEQRNLVYEDPHQPESPSEAAVRPLHQEEEYVRGGAEGEPHLQARAIVLPWKFSRPARQSMDKQTNM